MVVLNRLANVIKKHNEQKITGRAQLAGVVGYPVKHSLSPVLHNYWLRRYEIDGAYVPLCVASESFETAIYALQMMGFRGVNVTIPHKEAAYQIATRHDESAQRSGSVNTLVFETDGSIRGLSTDGDGFIASLEEKGVISTHNTRQNPKEYGEKEAKNSKSLDQCRVLVLGAGGAARSIVGALLSAGACVDVTNRSQIRAEALATIFNQLSVMPWNEWEQILGYYDMLINTTSLGMTGGGNPHFCPSLAAAKSDLVVADIVYTPRETPLLRAARQKNLQTVEGLGMLLQQARLGFFEWFGMNPEVDQETWKKVITNE